MNDRVRVMSDPIGKIVDEMLREHLPADHPVWTLPQERRIEVYNAVIFVRSQRG